MRRHLIIVLLLVPFAFCIVFAWAWFKSDIGRVDSQLNASQYPLWLAARTNVPGHIFLEEPVGQEVKVSLATSNILAGSFYKVERRNLEDAVGSERSLLNDQQWTASLPSETQPLAANSRMDSVNSILDAASRITVFFASWDFRHSKPLAILEHAPDVCWVASGWVPVRLKERFTQELSVGNSSLITRAQLFREPKTGRMELAMWVSLFDGIQCTYNLPVSFERLNVARPLPRRVVYRVSTYVNNLRSVLASRRRNVKSKQFVRLSVSVRAGRSSAYQDAIAEIKAFCLLWLGSAPL